MFLVYSVLFCVKCCGFVVVVCYILIGLIAIVHERCVGGFLFFLFFLCVECVVQCFDFVGICWEVFGYGCTCTDATNVKQSMILSDMQ